MPQSDRGWWQYRCQCGWEARWWGPAPEAQMMRRAAEVRHNGAGHSVEVRAAGK